MKWGPCPGISCNKPPYFGGTSVYVLTCEYPPWFCLLYQIHQFCCCCWKLVHPEAEAHFQRNSKMALQFQWIKWFCIMDHNIQNFVLISNSQTVWPSKILMLYFLHFQTIFFRILMLFFQNSVTILRFCTEHAQFWFLLTYH